MQNEVGWYRWDMHFPALILASACNIVEVSGNGASGRAAASCLNNLSLILLGAGLFSLSTNQWRVFNQVPPVEFQHLLTFQKII